MIILVTGDTGFIGRHLIDKLKTEHEVHGYDYNENHKPCIDGYDWVIHLGAISDTTERDVDKIMLQNYEFSKWIFKECNSKGLLDPKDVVNAINFLLSEKSNFISGQNIVVDDGYSL